MSCITNGIVSRWEDGILRKAGLPIFRSGTGGRVATGWIKTQVDITLVRFTSRKIKHAVPLTLIIKFLA